MPNKYVEMSMDDLLNEESELRTAVFNLRVENTTKALENTSKIRNTANSSQTSGESRNRICRTLG